MQTPPLQDQIEQLFDAPPQVYADEHLKLFARFKKELNLGHIRAAEPDSSSKTGWRANPWVKKGILLGFRIGGVVDQSHRCVKVALL